MLSTERLIAIGEKINHYFPEIETITCYTSIKNLKNKSLEDLKKLRSLKYNQLHVGLESAYDPALEMMNKGFNQNRTPFKEEKEAVGHAVLANYLYSGAVDVYSHTGDAELKAAIDRIYDSAVNKKMYITGAQGAYYHGMSSNLDPVEEAFGHDYELPSRVAYTETCANIANAMFNYRLLNVTGDSRYADIMEQVMYNSCSSS